MMWGAGVVEGNCWWECKFLVQSPWKSIGKFLKNLNRSTFSYTTPGCIQKGIQISRQQRDFHVHVYCGTVHNSLNDGGSLDAHQQVNGMMSLAGK